MIELFDVSPGSEPVNPMFGPAHLAAIAVLLALPLLLYALRGRLRHVTLSNPWVRGLSWFILVDEIFLFVLYFVYDYQPFWERFPLHLCAWLSLFMPIMTLAGRVKALRYVGVWAVGSGFMAVLNMNLAYNPVRSYVFFHYLWMHFYVFAFPLFLAIRGDMRFGYGYFWRSMGGLIALASFIFVLDWVLDVNYMYLGPSSTLEVPFVPHAWRQWPWSFPTFLALGLVLFHGFYALLLMFSPAARSRPKKSLPASNTQATG